jgi:Helix-turn-helix domain
VGVSAVVWRSAVSQGEGDVSIGETLAEARRQASLTVPQVSDQTRIKETIISDIEGDDYSALRGDQDVRGCIRSIAQAVGTDPDPLIREYDRAQLGQQASPDTATEPITFTRMGEWLWRAWFALVALAAVGLWFVAFQYLAGSRHAVTGAPLARAHPVAHHHPGYRGQAPSAPMPSLKTTAPGPALARTLTPASAAAFGPYGDGQGDDGDQAPLAIDGNPGTAWHTSWYTTAHFGNLYPGTGLLVDMGRSTTITAAQITLGPAHGAGFQLRVGATPALADLFPAAHAANAGGLVRLRLAKPAYGRYVLIWFTSLPPDPAGTFQASVYNLRLKGQA